jgi:hypothetical protein
MDPSSSGAQVAIQARARGRRGGRRPPGWHLPTASGATRDSSGADGTIVASPTGLQRHDATSGAVLARPDLHAVAAAGPGTAGARVDVRRVASAAPYQACRVAIIDGVSLADAALPSDGLADRAA